jgi:Holliday junction resolvase RusA-like endonuclease
VISFDLPRPPSVNAMFRNVPKVGRVRASTYRSWFKEASEEMMLQRVGQTVPKPPVAVSIQLPDSKGKADLGNYEKAVCDCLVSMGVLPDDSDKYVKRITLQLGAPAGRCLVTVEHMEAV